jgi:hypothetical protein
MILILLLFVVGGTIGLGIRFALNPSVSNLVSLGFVLILDGLILLLLRRYKKAYENSLRAYSNGTSSNIDNEVDTKDQ